MSETIRIPKYVEMTAAKCNLYDVAQFVDSADSYDEYRYKERELKFMVNKENALNGILTYGDLMFAISEDIEINNLDVLNIRIVAKSPIIFDNVFARPYMRIVWGGFFK